MNKQLLVNGYGMTSLTPITKMMAHLPLAFLDRPPQDALDICFGMGTTFRSHCSVGRSIRPRLNWCPACRGCSGTFTAMALRS